MIAKMVGFLASLTVAAIVPTSVGAASVVISQLQTGSASSAYHEAVELYNNGDEPTDITDWCIRYGTATSLNNYSTPEFCFLADQNNQRLLLDTRSYVTIATNELIDDTEGSFDGVFTGRGLADGGGHIRLYDADGQLVDTLGWGGALYAEGYQIDGYQAPQKPGSLQVLARLMLGEGVLQDTDNNKSDFMLTEPLFRSGGLIEVIAAVDVCPTLPDIQETLPDGYDYDEAGDCAAVSLDQCLNLEGVQTFMPIGFEIDEGTMECHVDQCSNISDLQVAIPAGYDEADGVCLLREGRVIFITEIFANASGVDTGKEFIEVYNPHGETVNLHGYVLAIGSGFSKQIIIENISIEPNSFMAFYDQELGFTLLNSANTVRMIAPSEAIVSEVPYVNPPEDQSWSLVSDVWQYTTVLTPGAENIPTTVSGELDVTKPLVSAKLYSPCGPGKYRHPITNRCRTIEDDTNMLVACADDEYRNPETNRCRKVVSLASSLTPCKEGYERNPDTNRCRKNGSVAAATLTPCKPGYERNPETNRCRKAGPAALAASVALEPVAVAKSEPDTWLRTGVMATIGVSAISYGLYEWRTELSQAWRRMKGLAKK